MTESGSAVRLLDVDPDVARYLSDDERAAVRDIFVPVLEVERGAADISAMLAEDGGFGAVVLEGMLMHQLRIGDQPTVRLLGPGDIVSVAGSGQSMLLEESSYTATAPTRLAILGERVLAAVQRWPRLAAGIFVRVAEQSDRLSAQLAICQLPRVDQRVLSLLWLLAESWGRVGSAGTSLPVSLTHDALGALIGARRPTVTLALGELSERGAIVRQDRGWLLLEAPPVSSGSDAAIEQPSLLTRAPSDWVEAVVPDPDQHRTREELMKTIGTLRTEHVRNREQVSHTLSEMRNARERCQEIRLLISRRRSAGGDSPVTRRAPS